MPKPRSPRPDPRPRILLLEQDAGVRRSLHLLLRAHGFDVRAFAAAEPLLAGAGGPDARFLIADSRADDTHRDLLRRLREAGWSGRAILLVDAPPPSSRDPVITAGYDAVIAKPLDPLVLLSLLDA